LLGIFLGDKIILTYQKNFEVQHGYSELLIGYFIKSIS